jgi:cobalt-zinc-cadmium efflux system protein
MEGSHHDHGHGPSHHHDNPHAGVDSRSGTAFRWSIVLNSGLTALQLAIGFGFGSLALIGDALHNLGDVVGLALGWGADRLSRRPALGRFTYGYGRSTQMASLINGLLIFAAGSVVVVEAIRRLFHPVPLIAGPVAWAAAAGIAINLLSARLFGHDHHLNQRAVVLHLLTDAAMSVAVLFSALGLLREAIALNLDAAPRHVDVSQVEQVLASLPAVLAVDDLHVWGLSTSRTALTAHVLIDPERLAELGIRKSTLQLETAASAGLE